MWKDKNVWIIGASRGIGAALAQQLNQEGAFVILSARDNSTLSKVQNQLSNPSQSSILPIDLMDTHVIDKSIQIFNQLNLHCDAIIHCGGISQRALSSETNLLITRQIFESNFFGHVQLTQGVLPKMLENKSGKIIVISSLTGKWGFYLRSSYAASKHALHGYYDSLRMEVEDSNVQVHIVTPGFIATDISKHAIDANGHPTGTLDLKQANGISPEDCARQILRGIAKNKREFGVGGKELLSLFLHQYFPKFFFRVLKKQSAR